MNKEGLNWLKIKSAKLKEIDGVNFAYLETNNFTYEGEIHSGFYNTLKTCEVMSIKLNEGDEFVIINGEISIIGDDK